MKKLLLAGAALLAIGGGLFIYLLDPFSSKTQLSQTTEQPPTHANPFAIVGHTSTDRHTDTPAENPPRQLTLRLPQLSEIFSAAKSSRNPDEKMNAVWIASICSTHSPAIPTSEEMEVISPDAQKQKSLMQRVVASRHQLSTFCSSGNADDYLRYAASNRSSLTSVTSQARKSSVSGGAPEFDEWEIAVLSSPAAYPVATNRWLENNSNRIFPRKVFDNLNQKSFVQDELFSRLVGDSGIFVGEIRTLHRCAMQYICPPFNLADDERRYAMLVVENLESKIRHQDWQSIRFR